MNESFSSITTSFKTSIKSLMHNFNNKQNEEDFREEFFQDLLKASANSKHYQLYKNLQVYPFNTRVDYLKEELEYSALNEDKQNIQEFLNKIENLNPDINCNITPRNASISSLAFTPTALNAQTLSMLQREDLNPELNNNITTRRRWNFQTTIKPDLSNDHLDSLKGFLCASIIPIIVIDMNNLTKEQCHSPSNAIQSNNMPCIVFEGESDNPPKLAKAADNKKDKTNEDLIYTSF